MKFNFFVPKGILIFTVLIVWSFSFTSCSYFDQKTMEFIPVARVNSTTLYRTDLDLTDTINHPILQQVEAWGKYQILMDQAKLNLPEHKQRMFDSLAEVYRKRLYLESYKDALVRKHIDTVVANDTLRAFYERTKSRLKLKDNLYQLRFLQLPKDASDLDKDKKRFTRYDIEDQEHFYHDISFYISFYDGLNDWLTLEDLYKKNPILIQLEKKKLEVDKLIVLEDQNILTWVWIHDKIKQGDVAPLSYITPIVKEMILHQRIHDKQQALEQELIQDAIKTKNFEIF